MGTTSGDGSGVGVGGGASGVGTTGGDGSGVRDGGGASVGVGVAVGCGATVAVGFGVCEGSAATCGMGVGIVAVTVGAAAGAGEGCGGPLWRTTKMNAAIARAANTIRARRRYDKLELSLCSVWHWQRHQHYIMRREVLGEFETEFTRANFNDVNFALIALASLPRTSRGS